MTGKGFDGPTGHKAPSAGGTAETGTDWSRPIEVSDVDVAFPACVMDKMPDREYCEKALEALPERGKAWRDLQCQWFFKGLPEGTTFVPKKGIDKDAALRHLRMIQGSFEPKHEHKEAAVAYLASRWFKKVKIPAAPNPEREGS